MPDSPLSDSPYEVLGVPADADAADAAHRVPPCAAAHASRHGRRPGAVPRRADRLGARGHARGARRVRSRHADGVDARADPGGVGARSHRRRGATRVRSPAPTATPADFPASATSRSSASGRAAASRVDDPYDPALVRSAPRDIRHVLADALAEEATARSLATLGIAYTVWHDIATDAAGPGEPPEARPHRARPHRALHDPVRGLGRARRHPPRRAHRRGARRRAADARARGCARRRSGARRG